MIVSVTLFSRGVTMVLSKLKIRKFHLFYNHWCALLCSYGIGTWSTLLACMFIITGLPAFVKKALLKFSTLVHDIYILPMSIYMSLVHRAES